MVGRLKSRIFVFLFKDRIICAFIAHEIVKLPLPKISFFQRYTRRAGVFARRAAICELGHCTSVLQAQTGVSCFANHRTQFHRKFSRESQTICHNSQATVALHRVCAGIFFQRRKVSPIAEQGRGVAIVCSVPIGPTGLTRSPRW
jgi:hypothetical protein